jgi:SulP family sulfate permease
MKHLRADLIAGLSVAVMGVPQAMAYAMIAGLPPVYGLYTATITCFVAALIGSSNHLVIGPTNASCMVLFSLTVDLAGRHTLSPLQTVLLLTFMTGALQFLFGALRFGGVIRYISQSVVIGFTAGAGILIAGNQLKNILGIDIQSAQAERFHEVLVATFRGIGDTNPRALFIGVLTAAIGILAPRLHRRLPGTLLGVGLVGLASYFLGWHLLEPGFRVTIVQDLQPIRGSLPSFQLPDLIAAPSYALMREVGTGAAALAILGLIEAASIARAVAARSGQRLNFNREFMAQGSANMVGSCFSSFVGSGSFTRTSMCYQTGGQTRMAAAFSAGWTALALLVLGPIANYIPQAALAGILIVIAYSMVDKRRLGLTWKSGRNPRLVLAGTLVSTLLLPLEYAIFVGVFLSIVMLLRTTGRTYLTQLVAAEDGGFEEVPFNRAAPAPVVTVNMEGALYFAAAEDLDYELLRCTTTQTRVVVLRMKRLRAVGGTAMAMLEHFSTLLHERDIYLVVSGIEEELEGILTSSGVRQQIGEQNIFYADNRLFQSTQLALARAWSIVELDRRIGQASPPLAEAKRGRAQVSAADIMKTRCIRFGNQHQLREAVWLMSGLQAHTRSISPEPLFLQDREAKLAGELSPWRLLEVLTENLPENTSDPRLLGEHLRRDFTRGIDTIARLDVDRLEKDASLARLMEVCVEQDLQVIPICDHDGRIKGLVSADDLLRALFEMLSPREAGSAAAGDSEHD